jgi:HSP20 family protein
MSLVRNMPATPIVRRSFPEDLFAGFERLFDDMGRSDNGLPMDFYETDVALVLELAVPGVNASGVDVSVEGRQLTVRAELPIASSEENRRYWLRSLPHGAYTRTIRLPMGVDLEHIDAKVQNGVLRLEMHKAAEAKARKLQIADG